MKRARRDTICYVGRSGEADNFYTGMPVNLHLCDDGRVRPERWYEGVARRVRTAWRRATRWFRPRLVVDHVDARGGLVTIREERWSWRRWRWELG